MPRPKPSFCVALFLYIALVFLCQEINGAPQTAAVPQSEKGRKLAFGDESPLFQDLQEQEEQDEDDGDFGFDEFSFGDLDDDDSFGFGGGDGDDDDDDNDGSDDDIQLPLCSTLSPLDVTLNRPCTNETSPAEEVRLHDALLERLVGQVWRDFQLKLNAPGAELGGVAIDPLDVDAQLAEPIALVQSGGGYQADVKMLGIRLFGLSSIRLDQSVVTRNENLTDMHVDVRFAFDQLLINGTYELKGRVGWWSLDSQGWQDFSIAMLNATFSYRMHLETVDGEDSWRSFSCDPQTGNVLITEIGLPLEYSDIDFRFNNLGAFANTVVNGVGIYFLQTQEEKLIGELRAAIKKEVNSLIC